MRQCAVGAGGDDRWEGEPLRAEPLERELEVERDVEFAMAGVNASEQLPERLVGQPRGLAQASQFAGILAGAQCGHDARGLHPLDPFDLAAPLGQRLHAQIVGLDAGAFQAQLVQRLAQRLDGVLVNDDVEAGALRLRLLLIAKIGHEDRFVGRHHDGAGGAGKAGDVTPVLGLRDDEAFQVAFGQGLAQPLDA
ncbi:MAG TPA: hypothetical protein VFK80_08530 [Limnochordia bacterium]|nr:hypothetical protein [Limnochordia bacterium]